MMTEFGVAMVYIDDELVETVYTYGPESNGNLLFERTDLTPGEHTIRIVHSLKFIDIDYLAYATAETVDPAPEPEPEFQVVDAMDDILVYTGNWTDDSNENFESGFARYTNESDASVSLTFEGSTVRWYGQTDTNFGSARVYLDDELVETVSVNGQAEVQQLLFEMSDLGAGEHTLRIVCETPVIDIDYFSYG